MAENRIKNWKSPSELARYFRDDKNRLVDGKSMTDEQKKVHDEMEPGEERVKYRRKCEQENWTPEYREYKTGKSNIPRNDIFDVEDP